MNLPDNSSNEDNVNNIESVGFIITRHVNSTFTNNFWITCINRIRIFYPTVLIVIVDNNSNYDFISYPTNFLENCIVIDSEYKYSGELSPYYYFYHNKWFEKAICIHDTFFINHLIDISNVNNIKYLYGFESWQIYHERPNIETLLMSLNHKDELFNLLNNGNWVGCRGVMSVIKHSYIKKLSDKYNLFTIMPKMKIKDDRQAVERILGIVCFHDKELTVENASIYGMSFCENLIYEYHTYMDALNSNSLNINHQKIQGNRK